MNEVMFEPRDPLHWGMRADRIEDFSPLGGSMRLLTNSEAILEACRTSFGKYEAGLEDRSEPSITLGLYVDPGFDASPPWPDPVFRANGSLFYVSAGRQNTAVADLETGRATGFLSPAMAADGPMVRRTFLDCLVLTLLTHGRRGPYTYVHASAVSRDGAGILFSGPSGSGKSTLAYACARAGFSFVTDDVAYLKRSQGALTAWGRPWRLRMTQSGLGLFPELAGLRRDAGPAEAVLELDLDGLLPGRCLPACDPVAVFFLSRTAGDSRYQSVDEAGAMRLISRDMVYELPEALARHRRHWRELVRRGAYLLSCGPDLASLVALLHDFVDKRQQGRLPT